MANMSLVKNPRPSQDPNVRNKNFDEAMKRGSMYRQAEAEDREAECNLLNKKPE